MWIPKICLNLLRIVKFSWIIMVSWMFACRLDAADPSHPMVRILHLILHSVTRLILFQTSWRVWVPTPVAVRPVPVVVAHLQQLIPSSYHLHPFITITIIPIIIITIIGCDQFLSYIQRHHQYPHRDPVTHRQRLKWSVPYDRWPFNSSIIETSIFRLVTIDVLSSSSSYPVIWKWYIKWWYDMMTLRIFITIKQQILLQQT